MTEGLPKQPENVSSSLREFINNSNSLLSGTAWALTVPLEVALLGDPTLTRLQYQTLSFIMPISLLVSLSLFRLQELKSAGWDLWNRDIPEKKMENPTNPPISS